MFSFVSTTTDSQKEPPPKAVLPLEFAAPHFHVSEPFWPGAGIGVQLQMRAPFDARKAWSAGLAPPASPEPSPTMTMPRPEIGALEPFAFPLCEPTEVSQTTLPVVWSRATTRP